MALCLLFCAILLQPSQACPGFAIYLGLSSEDGAARRNQLHPSTASTTSTASTASTAHHVPVHRQRLAGMILAKEPRQDRVAPHYRLGRRTLELLVAVLQSRRVTPSICSALIALVWVRLF